MPARHIFARVLVDGGTGHILERNGRLRRNDVDAAAVLSMRPWRLWMTKHITPVPEENKSHKGPGSEPAVPIDTTKGHRDDEKHNIREQGAHGNLTQNTSNRRSG
jgi:hypothetical protein